MRISVVGISGDADREIQTVAGAITANLVRVVHSLTQEAGDAGKLARHVLELLEGRNILLWLGKFESITARMVTAAYIYPDPESVIPAIIARVDSRELLRDCRTWGQETFMSVAIAILGSAQAFDDLGSEFPRRALNVAKFDEIFQQDPTRVEIKPLRTMMQSR